ncbi:MAG: STAS domain-containing protein [Eubacterium sp.]|nr:STAS domain-containing protein [Eubacterium sp.]
MKIRVNKDRLLISLDGSLDSNNARNVEEEILRAVEANSGLTPSFDMSELKYISSAGLRVLMKVRKIAGENVEINDVTPDVYEIFDTTGMSEIFKIRKKMRELSIEGLDIIGEGCNGKVYRLDADTIVKVYEANNALEIIENEKKMAKMAFLKGIPTAISFDIVKVGDTLGAVFELLDAKTFNDLIIEDPGSIDDIVKKYVDVMKQIHDTEVEKDVVPVAKDIYKGYLEKQKKFMPEEMSNKLSKLLDEMKVYTHLVHGDIQMKNVMLSDGEPMIIDMDTLCMGHPLFDFCGLYVTYKLFKEDEPDNTLKFLGISSEISDMIWDKTFRYYYADKAEEEREVILNKIRILASIRFLYLISGTVRMSDERAEKRISHTISHINELLDKVDDLN